MGGGGCFWLISALLYGDNHPLLYHPWEISLLKFVSLRFVSLRFVSLRFVSLKFMSLKFVSLRFVPLRFVSLRFVFWESLNWLICYHLPIAFFQIKWAVPWDFFHLRCSANQIIWHAPLSKGLKYFINLPNTAELQSLHGYNNCLFYLYQLRPVFLIF